MIEILPFRAIRPRRDLVAQIAAPPYDIVDDQEARRICLANPLSFLQVEKTGASPAESHLVGQEADPYHQSRRFFEYLWNSGALLQDSTPCFYLYLLSSASHDQLGLASVLPAHQYKSGLIKKHELTRYEKEQDRIRHFEVLGAQTGPVFLAYRAVKAIDLLLASFLLRDPEYDFSDDAGVRHRLWVIADEREIEAIRGEFSLIPSLYIADGHHRAAAAASLLAPAGQTGSGNGSLLAVLFPHDQLCILPYHRLVKGRPQLTSAAFRERLEAAFLVEPLPNYQPPGSSSEFSLYWQGRWFLLRVRDYPSSHPDPLGHIPAQILEDKLLKPILGIADPRGSRRLHFAGGNIPSSELARQVDNKDFDLAVCLFPTTCEDLMQVADSGLLMPPKSTWFEPKLKSGLLVHRFTLP
jgi:uncharacterized protein (DUF1015 family)